MVRVELKEAWIYAGEVYGPGEAEMPDDVQEALGEKGAFTQSEQAKADAAMQAVQAQAVESPKQGKGK